MKRGEHEAIVKVPYPRRARKAAYRYGVTAYALEEPDANGLTEIAIYGTRAHVHTFMVRYLGWDSTDADEKIRSLASLRRVLNRT